jgi:RNA polymerase sigma-70 factor, ECF subfamily
MLTQVESTSVCVPSSLVFEDADPTVQLRRHELTDLVVREKNHFLRVAGSILRNNADAEDVLHSSFCSAWKALAAFRGESSMKTWFTRIVSNHAIGALRKMRRKTVLFLEDNPEYLHTFEQNFSFTVEDPEKTALRREVQQLIPRHIEYLPEETRVMVALFFSDNLSIQQIAKLRGKSGSSVKAHLHRGKTLLRKSICRRKVRRVAAARC